MYLIPLLVFCASAFLEVLCPSSVARLVGALCGHASAAELYKNGSCGHERKAGESLGKRGQAFIVVVSL